MPGLNQLKKFSNDIKVLGNEVEKRTERGEPIVQYPLPQNVPEDDDSADFIFGLPTDETMAITQKDDSPNLEELTTNNINANANNSAEVDASGDGLLPGEIDPELAKFFQSADDDSIPEFESAVDTNLSNIEDLPQFDDITIDDNEAATETAEPVEVTTDATADSDTDALNILSELSQMEPPSLEEENAEPVHTLEQEPGIEPVENSEVKLEDQNDDFLDEINAIQLDSEMPAENVGAQDLGSLESLKTAEPVNTDVSDFDVEDVEDLEPLEELSEDDGASQGETDFALQPTESFEPPPDINLDEIATSDAESENIESDSIPINDIADKSLGEIEATFIPEEEGDAESSLESDVLDTSTDENPVTEPVSNEESLSFELPPDVEFGAVPDVSSDSIDTLASDDSPLDSIDSSAPAITDIDDFDTTDGLLNSNFDTKDSDFDSEFDIPDISGIGGGPSTVRVSSSGDFNTGSEKRDSLSDAEYEVFKKNMADYPLNLRIAIEEMIAKNEFTDDAVFAVIEKILKKASARQLASHIAKYLDISVDVPRDFERRTATQYQAYKQSLQYQLKNRIIPALFVSVFVLGFIALFSYLGNKYVYEPMAAEKAYKEGYVLLENSMYQQAELKFAQGVQLKPKKRWFFNYARGYRERKQYDRARQKYELLLNYFNYDKAAGIEYADMEFSDLENYAAAENILERDVLDNYINDKDAMLMLGDVYLDWAVEKDSTKFSAALREYSELIELYGNNNLYSSRLLRYYIRTDQLKDVLQLKSYFYKAKNSLTAPDLIELSGYMLDKLYGYLPPAEEYLRSQIEDVRSLLERAVEADSTFPEANYNLGRYFVQTGNPSAAIQRLEIALDQFNRAEKRKPVRIYKQINTYRLLGELNCQKQEYIQAEELYGEGVQLFEKENKHSSLEPVTDVGKLYADLADIDYFISGNLEPALYNYKQAMNCEYDVPSVRYRIGYISYSNGDLDNALDLFLSTVTDKKTDENALYALATTFSLNDDQIAAHGYYSRLINILDNERSRHKILFPQVRADQYELVDMYMKASNNLGVTMSKLAQRTGDSEKNAKAMVQFSESIRAYDALTRNQETMVRMEGSNLAAQNMKYLTSSRSQYEPAIYTEIPKVLKNEKTLQQDYIK